MPTASQTQKPVMSTEKTTLKITTISDLTCAWCILSHRILTSTLTTFRKTYPSSHITFSPIYRPYYLHMHSSLPIPPLTHSVPKSEISKVKLEGWSEEKIKGVRARMDRLGRAVGVVFKEGELIGPTRDAHCLVHVARERDMEVQVEFYGRLLSWYHEEGGDIADREALRRIAGESGLSEEDIQRAWSEDVGNAVDEEEKYWRGVADGKGVPVVIVEGPKGEERIDGCPDGGELYETFVRVLEGSEAMAA